MNNNKPKVFIPKVGESWVVDRFRDEWLENNLDLKAKFIFNANIIWIIAPWIWRKIPKYFLTNKYVICTIHHFEEKDLTNKGLENFFERDKYVNAYHAISLKTYKELKDITNKKIYYSPFWVNEKIWFKLNNKDEIRNSFGFDKDDFIVGSFQRDTEGKDLKSPKLIKGPDRFLTIVLSLKKEKNNLKVLLAGTRRQYLINEFEKHSIDYKYIELPSFEKLNELYNILDLYIVSSRNEGGPQALLECAIIKTPIISTDVGIAGEILSNQSIFDMNNFYNATPNTQVAYENVAKFRYENHINSFNKMFYDLNTI